MEENNTRTETKITLGLIISWVLGVITAIAGAGMLFKEPVPGLLFILLALVLLPPANKFVKERFNISLSGGVKFILVVLLLGAVGGTVGSSSQSKTTPTTNDGQSTEQANATDQKDDQEPVEVVDISTKVTEQNSVWHKYAWNLTLKNNTDRDKTISADIQWVDAEGFVIDSHTEYSLSVPAGQEKTFTDFVLISVPGATNVESVKAEISGF
jgi:hypothetical protein